MDQNAPWNPEKHKFQKIALGVKVTRVARGDLNGRRVPT